VLWAVWIGLAIGVLATAAGVFGVVRGVLAALRSLRSLRTAVGGGLAALTRSVERLADHPDAPARLGPALGGLERSRAQLAVLLAAIDEVQDSVTRVTVFYPRK
jgi:hypothetical protein